MADSLNHNWTVQEHDDAPKKHVPIQHEEEPKQEEQVPVRERVSIPITPRKHSAIVLPSQRAMTLMVVGVMIVLSVIFLRGLNFLSANISDSGSGLVEVILADDGFSPVDVSVSVGQSIEWFNEGAQPDKFLSKEKGVNGLPLIESPLLRKDQRFRFKIEAELAGEIIHMVSAMNPEKQGTITVATNSQTSQNSSSSRQQSSASSESSKRMVPSRMGTPSRSVPSVPMSQPIMPPVPSLNPSPAPTSVSPQQPVRPIVQAPNPSWPSLLRVNTHTGPNVSSPAVTPISRHVQPPSNVSRHAAASEKQSADDHPALHASAQPSTGPGLGILFGIIGFAGMGMWMWRKRG